MRKIYIDLDNGRLVKDFVDAIGSLQGSFELISGRTVLDAKSILGIYCLNLSERILLHIDQDTEENIEALKNFFAK